MAGNRAGGGQEPDLVLGLREDNSDRSVASRLLSTGENLRGQILRAFPIRVKKDENPPGWPALASCKFDGSFKFVGLEESLAFDADRRGYVHVHPWRSDCCDAPN
jgi:hypothetical protein